MSHLSDALKEYSCGPGAHRASYGMSIGQQMRTQVPICAVCFKSLGEQDCLFCNQPGDGAFSVTSRGRTIEGPLCARCRDGLLAGEGGDWRLA